MSKPRRRAALMAMLILSGPMVGKAQDGGEEQQLCINQCMYHHGPAGSTAYDACVARRCMTPESPVATPPPQATPRQPLAPASTWTRGRTDGGRTHFARLEAGALALTYMCQSATQGLMAIEGLRGRPGSIRLLIDGRPLPQPFAAKDGMRATPAPSGAALLTGLLTGKRLQISDDRGGGSVSLAGSGKAIGATLSACGLSK